MADDSHDPVLFTNERMRALGALAIELAVTAPDVRLEGSNYGRVPWSLIERARRQCEEVGIDWRVLREQAIATSKLGALFHDSQKQEGPS